MRITKRVRVRHSFYFSVLFFSRLEKRGGIFYFDFRPSFFSFAFTFFIFSLGKFSTTVANRVVDGRAMRSEPREGRAFVYSIRGWRERLTRASSRLRKPCKRASNRGVAWMCASHTGKGIKIKKTGNSKSKNKDNERAREREWSRSICPESVLFCTY